MRGLQQSLLRGSMLLVMFSVTGDGVRAQVGGYSPVDHRTPGIAGRWSAATRPGIDRCPQPVRIQLPSDGEVTFFSGPEEIASSPSPAQASMIVGPVYRVRISGMSQFPGVELYPTVELLDRLHPPDGRAHEFPIPIEITAEEIEIALQDRLVTKVVYLEQPDLASPQECCQPMPVTDFAPCVNLLQAADQRGRVMAILRLGGRVPDERASEPQFFGDFAPVITGGPEQTRTSPTAPGFPATSWNAPAGWGHLPAAR